MTSKNSFWVRIKENNKRRSWVWILSLLTFVLVWPAQVFLMINQIRNSNEWYAQEYGAEVAQRLIREELLQGMEAALGFSELLIVAVAVVAVLSAIQGFSWLYSRKKTDFYMGMPVKRKKRFLYIWLNGILIFLIPYVMGMAISAVVAMANGGMNSQVLESMLAAFGTYILYYLGVYHLAILAVMLTGNIIITVMGFGVFCLYEGLVRGVFYQYHSSFFKHFDSYQIEETPLLSPFSLLAKSMDAGKVQESLPYIIGMAAFALVIGILAYICYMKRPAEAAGKALTFKWTGSVIKVLLVIPTALLAAIAIGSTIGFDQYHPEKTVGYLLVSMAVVVVFGSGLMQAIYEFDIRGMLHKKWHIAISGVLTAFIFAIFYFDLFGYDAYVPDADQVESVAFIPEPAELVNGQYNAYYEDWNRPLSATEYGDKYMYLTNVEAVCELARISTQEYNKLSEEDIYGTEAQWSDITLIYRMKSGRKVVRQLYVNVDDEKVRGYLDEIVGSKAYKQGVLIGYSGGWEEIIKDEGSKLNITYGNTVYEKKLSREELLEFLEIYRQDLDGMNFTSLKENLPVGGIVIEFSRSERSRYQTRTYSTYVGGINVYPFMEKSIAYLKEHGCYYDYQLNPEDVEYIQVVNYNSDAYRELYKQQNSDALVAELTLEVESDEEIDTKVYANYTEEDQIRQIADSVYSDNILGYYNWVHGKEAADYSVIVYFKAGSEISRKYGVSAYYNFLEGEVPEFVREDTQYQP